MKRFITIGILAALLMGSSAFASYTTLVFSEPDFQWHQTGGPATPYHIWATGDYWSQNFLNTGLGSAADMSLRLYIDDNILSAGDAQDLDILLNGTTVGSITIASGVTGALDYHFMFPQVWGDDYEVKLLATNTIPPLHGSISMAPDGRSWVTLAPIPAPGAILLGGIGAGLVGWLRRRRTI